MSAMMAGVELFGFFDARVFDPRLFDLGAVARVSTVQIVDCLVEGTVIAMLAALGLQLARRQSAASRFAVWFGALVAIASLPLIGRGWTGQSASSAGGAGLFTLPESLAAYVCAVWAAVAVFGLLRVIRGLWHLCRLRESFVDVDPATLDSRLRETLAAQTGRQIAFCTSDRVQVPTAIGLMRPAVVIPAWVMDELSAEELNQILLHELAHLRRWDDWTNLAQKVVKAVLFFHPAVWWIEKKVSLEREMACDDAVIEVTTSPRAYAECLTHLAERTLVQRSLALAQAALGKIRQTTHRVAAILDFDRNGNRTVGMGWKPAAAWMAGLAVVLGVGFSHAPRLIGFSDAGRTALPAVAASMDVRLPAGVALIPASASSSTLSPSISAPSIIHAKFSSDSAVRVRPAKLRVPAHSGKRSLAPPATPLISMLPQIPELTIPESPIDAFLRRASFDLSNAEADEPGFTETIFVVIQTSEANSSNRSDFQTPAFQIQMWRVMVLHPVVGPDANRIPARKT